MRSCCPQDGREIVAVGAAVAQKSHPTKNYADEGTEDAEAVCDIQVARAVEVERAILFCCDQDRRGLRRVGSVETN